MAYICSMAVLMNDHEDDHVYQWVVFVELWFKRIKAGTLKNSMWPLLNYDKDNGEQ